MSDTQVQYFYDFARKFKLRTFNKVFLVIVVFLPILKRLKHCFRHYTMLIRFNCNV